MRKSTKSRLIFLLILALAAFFVFYRTNKNPAPKSNDSVAQQQNVFVMVASKDFSSGDNISPDDITWKEFDKTKLSPGYFTKSGGSNFLRMRVIISNIKEGDVIYQRNLRYLDNNWDVLSPGMALHGFKVNASRGIGSMIKPNTFVRIVYVEDGESVVIVDHAKVIGVKNNRPENRKPKNVIDDKVKLSKNPMKELLHSSADTQYIDPNDLVDDDVFVELTPQMAQMLSIEHKGSYILIPVKYHANIVVPSVPYRSGDLAETFIQGSSLKHGFVKVIKGDKVSFVDLNNLIRQELNRKPVDVKMELVKPPYRLDSKDKK